MADIQDKVNESWKTWSNREYIIYQHLEALFNAQNALSELEAYIATTQLNADQASQKEYEMWNTFLKPFNRTLKFARVKVLKSSDEQIIKAITASVEAVQSNSRFTVRDYDNILYAISLLYDELGYSSPEQKRVTSPFISDLDIGIGDEEELVTDAVD